MILTTVLRGFLAPPVTEQLYYFKRKGSGEDSWVWGRATDRNPRDFQFRESKTQETDGEPYVTFSDFKPVALAKTIAQRRTDRPPGHGHSQVMGGLQPHGRPSPRW